MRIVHVGIALVVLLLAGCDDVSETTFPNGLKVIVKEDHRSPVVVSQLWYKIGSVDEPEGLTGISHVLEHMMFKGTKRYKAGEFSRIIAENGGRDNAFTARDYTVYFQQLEKSRLPIAFELEADRMQNLLLKDEEFQKEVRVVMEERRMRTDDNPQALVYERFMRTAYPDHPYGQPIIGWMRDLQNMKADDLRAWYERWYTPNNAILVVVGDVEPRDVFALARKHFGPIPKRPVERDPPPDEPNQNGLRREVVKAPAEVPYVVTGFHVPEFRKDNAQEAYALDVLSAILDGGASARFARNLVRGQQIAVNVGADYGGVNRYPTIFAISGVPANGKDVGELLKAALAQVEQLKREPIDPEEMARVKAQVVAGEIYERDSVFGQAMAIGMLETVGLDWRMIDEYVKRVQAVTPEQVQAVARKYLVEDNMTVVRLDPQPIDPKKRPAPAAQGMDHAR